MYGIVVKANPEDKQAGRFVRMCLEAKQLEFTCTEGMTYLFRHKELELIHPLVIMEYLEDRCPDPRLLSSDCDQRARERMILYTLESNPEFAQDLVLNASPFVLGAKLTAIDLWIASLNNANLQEFNDRVDEELDRALV